MAADNNNDDDDDLLLLDLGKQHSHHHHHHSLLLDIFDPAVETIPVEYSSKDEVGGGDEDEDEEELEWLSNKDAFPALETCFEAPAGQQPSPASVLEAAAAPPYRVPVRPRSKGRRRGRGVLPVFKPPPPRRPEVAKRAQRRCRHCETEDTPQWRAGPDGPKTLCNACGVRYKSGRLVPEYRPASSPTFSTLHHSNSHRRILEMRRRRGGGDAVNPPLPPPAEAEL